MCYSCKPAILQITLIKEKIMTDKEIYQLGAIIAMGVTRAELEIKEEEKESTMSIDRKITRLITAGILAAMKHINK
jgi:hypothetical protein